MTCPWLERSLEDYTALCYKIRRDRERGYDGRMEKLLMRMKQLENEMERHILTCGICKAESYDGAA